jgi:secreted PhoX family phosphatase
MTPTIASHPDRRSILRAIAALAAAGMLPAPFAREAVAASGPTPYGPLGEPDANGIMLPAGFTAREIARAGTTVPGTAYTWHRFPDGGATFRARGGWIYVSNSEQGAPLGGVGALRFNRRGAVVAGYAICTGTARNCAGGATPWGTWLTCEEVPDGNVFECDPTGARPAERRRALGTFQHEAVGVEPVGRRLYLTEDQADGRFYRFTPTRWRRLDAGLLEVAVVEGETIRWVAVPNPNPVIGTDTPTRLQVPESTAFRGGEGVAVFRRQVYFTTKGDNRVWVHDTRRDTLRVLYDAAQDPGRQLTGVDNCVAGRTGDIVVAEDGGNMEVVAVGKAGLAAPIFRIVGQDGSELAGPAFDPAFKRLYISSQRGGDGGGLTYEITGPFRNRKAG